jgi:ankyrin repeat protein
MRSLMNRARHAAAALVFCAACESNPPRSASSPTPIAVPATHVAAERNVAMGTGEFRKPEPFTIEQRLLDAVRRNDRATVERALERGAPIDAKDDLQRSTVLLAVLDAGNLELVTWLHAKGAAVDEPDIGGRTALSFAAAAGRLDLVRYLIEQGAQVDRADVQKRTPLFHAALGDHSAVVVFLLEHGADVNARDQFGDTPLIVACAKGHAATAAVLLAHSADPTLRDQEGRTARDRAVPGTAPCITRSPLPQGEGQGEGMNHPFGTTVGQGASPGLGGAS